EVVPLPVDLEHQLVQVPLVAWPRASSPHAVGEGWPELAAPAADGLVADRDAALGQQLLHVAVAEQEAEGQPHGMADAHAREEVALIERRRLAHRGVLRHAPSGTPFG